MSRIVPALVALLAGAALASEPPPPRPTARMSGASNASEYFDLVARFDGGHRLVARFLVTNEGPGEHTAVAVGHVVLPDGSVKQFRNGRREDRWDLEADGSRLHIGSSVLDLRPPLRRLEVDNEKRGIKIFLSIEADPVRSRAPEDGSSYRVELLDSAARASGSIWFRGMAAPAEVEGRASLSHTWMREAEETLALRRLDFASLDSETSLSFVDLTTPGGPPLRWLAIEKAGRILYETGDFELSLGGSVAGASERGYPVPATLEIANEALKGRVALESPLVTHDPLDDLPALFRFLLSSRSRPRRVWTDSRFEMKVETASDRSPLEVRGAGIATVTFTNPLASP